jgi:hypothetical protein
VLTLVLATASPPLIQLAANGFPATATAPFITPFMKNSTVFVTVPGTGNVHEVLVNFQSGAMTMGRVLNVGGQPQMAVIAEQERAA